MTAALVGPVKRVTLWVRDLERSLAVYRDALGLQVLEQKDLEGPAIAALVGLRLRSSFAHRPCPGTARSRENANSMRDAAVMHDIPQKYWPTQEMTRIVFAQLSGSAVRSTTGEKPNASLISCTCVAAKSIDSSRIQPPTPLKKIERQSPWAAAFDAPPVSSETCAEASKPVIVYCVSRKPSGST